MIWSSEVRNKHPGICYLCRKVVDAREGYMQRVNACFKSSNGEIRNNEKWIVRHTDCSEGEKKDVAET